MQTAEQQPSDSWASVTLDTYWDTSDKSSDSYSLPRDDGGNVGTLMFTRRFVDRITSLYNGFAELAEDRSSEAECIALEFDVEEGWAFRPVGSINDYDYFRFRMDYGGALFLVFNGAGYAGWVIYTVDLPSIPKMYSVIYEHEQKMKKQNENAG